MTKSRGVIRPPYLRHVRLQRSWLRRGDRRRYTIVLAGEGRTLVTDRFAQSMLATANESGSVTLGHVAEVLDEDGQPTGSWGIEGQSMIGPTARKVAERYVVERLSGHEAGRRFAQRLPYDPLDDRLASARAAELSPAALTTVSSPTTPAADNRHVTIDVAVCEWCGGELPVGRRGRKARFCSAAHRQAAYRQRHPMVPAAMVDASADAVSGRAPQAGPGQPDAAPGVIAADERLAALLDELAAVLDTPGDEAQLALWAVAKDLVAVSGRPTPDDADFEVVTPLGAKYGARRPRRPRSWGGRHLPRPATQSERLYQRSAGSDGEAVTVQALRAGKPHGAAKPLWLRRHKASEHTDWRSAYDWTDDFGVPDSRAIYALGADMLADAVDLKGELGRWYDAWILVRHFVGDVLWPLGDRSWVIRRSELLNWLDVHGYLQSVT